MFMFAGNVYSLFKEYKQNEWLNKNVSSILNKLYLYNVYILQRYLYTDLNRYIAEFCLCNKYLTKIIIILLPCFIICIIVCICLFTTIKYPLNYVFFFVQHFAENYFSKKHGNEINSLHLHIHLYIHIYTYKDKSLKTWTTILFSHFFIKFLTHNVT